MKLLILILVSFILFVLYDKYHSKKSSLNIETFQEDNRPKLWVYTDNSNHEYQPKCFDLSIKSIYRYCQEEFNIIQLSPDNIYSYLPDLPINTGCLSETESSQQEQIIKTAIMYRYGGLWIPPNIIILQSLLPIISKLEDKEIVLFGCPDKNLRCFDSSLPDFNVVASRPYINMWNIVYQKLIKDNKKFLNSSFEYNNIGRKLLWENCKNMYDAIHIFDSKYDGTRDYNRKLITNDELFSNNNILLQDSKSCFFLIYNYNNIKKSTKYRWFLNLSLNELMTSNLWISKIYRLSLLGIDTTVNDVYNTSVRNT